MFLKRWYKILYITFGLLLISVLIFGTEITPGPDVQKETSSVIITLKNPLKQVLQTLNLKRFFSRGARITSLKNEMTKSCTVSQVSVLETCRRYHGATESFWITNQIHVKNASKALLKALEAHTDVVSVNPVVIIAHLPQKTLDVPAGNFTLTSKRAIGWNVRKIRAGRVWRRGFRGKGIRVAVIDTGVRRTHKDLVNNYVGASNNGWFDPVDNTVTPSDFDGHGTHCTGTICGKNGIGVAPDAKWMACRGCGQEGCSTYGLIACGQWVLCPTDPQGENADCSKAPDIVSNSWGGAGNDPWYNAVINAWNAAGILPFFAVGNDPEGPRCSSAGSPADQPGVISVGSTDRNDSVSWFSGRGPKIGGGNGDVAPLIVAPGEDIRSATNEGDNSYENRRGTSMAAPHGAGAAALLLSKKRNLNLSQMKRLLFSTSYRRVKGLDELDCGSKNNKYPNNVAGYGRINVLRAFRRLNRRSKS